VSRTLRRPHLIWGWRGTLADDVEHQVGAVNAALVSLGEQPAGLDTVRRHFATTVSATCAGILGRALSEGERTRAGVAYETYHVQQPSAPLRPETEELLTRLVRSMCSHSVLSLSAHGPLTRHISALGIGSLFVRIDGRTSSFRSKKQPLTKHLAAVRHVVGQRPIVLIGDAVDDLRAAHANQIHAIAFAGGLTHPDVLRRSAAPVADSLDEAAALAVEYARTA